MKLFKTIMVFIILLLFVNVKSNGQSPVIDFSYSPATIVQGDTVTFTNLSANVNDSIVFIWELPYCIYQSHFKNSISCFDTTTGVDETVKYRFLYVLDYTITLTALNKYNLNIIGTESKVLKADIGQADCEEEICSFLCNGDFESLDDTLSPPTGRGQMGGYTRGWFNNANPKATSDLFDTASSISSQVSIPHNFAGYQETLHPNEHGYIGLINYMPDACGNPTNYREFVMQILTRPMNVDQDYVVGLYYALSTKSRYTNDNLGIYLTQGIPIQDYSNEHIFCNGDTLDSYGIYSFGLNQQLHQTLQPQVSLANSIPDKGVWHKLTGIVHATDSFNVITIGGFKNNDSTLNDPFYDDSTMIVDIGGQPVTACYIYIDSVFVYPLLKNKSFRDTVCLGYVKTLTSSIAPPSTTFYTWNTNIHGTGINSITIKPKNDTVVICTAMDSYGCTMIDTFYIKIEYPLINITAGNTCFEEPTNFSAQYQTCPDSIYAYSWDFGDGSTVSTLSNPSHTYSSAGNYTACLTYTLYGGYMRSTCVTFQIFNTPELVVTGPNNSCGLSSNYTIADYNPPQYLWKFDTTSWHVVNSNPFPVTYQSTNDTGNLIVRYFDSNGCYSFDTIHIFACCTAGTEFVNWANTTISNDSTITRAHIINGTVTINANITFKHGLIKMGPDAKLVVNAGKNLVFNKATVQQGCNYMWDGIYAETPTSLIKIDSSSIVQDAINGIVSSNGGQIFLRNSSFRYNYYNVIIRNFTTANNPAYFSGCRFTGADALTYPPMHPQPTFIGIVIDSVGNEYSGSGSIYYATIGDTIAGTTGGSIINNSKCNYFRKTGVGIFVKNSNANIYNCYFSRENNAYGTGSAVYIQGKTLSGQQVNTVKHFVNIGGSNAKRIVVDSSFTGVFSDKNIDLNVIKNKFYYNSFGVVFMDNNYYISTMNRLNNVYINYNTFLTCNYSVYATANNVCSSNIRYNRINDSTTSGNWYSFGILINGTQQNLERNYICFNKVTSKGTGINTLALVGTTWVDDNYVTLPTLAAATFGIRVQNCPGIKVRKNAVITADMSDTYGISVEQTNTATLQCDSVVCMQFGITFWGANLSNNNSVLQGCSFNACSYGLVKTSNAIIGNQGTRTTCKDNKWYNFSPYTHSYCLSSPVRDTLFVRSTILGNIYNPSNNVNNGGPGIIRYLVSPAPAVYKCNTIQQMQIILGGLSVSENNSGLFNAIADESISYAGNNFDAEYLTKQALYKLIINNPSEFANSVNMADYITSTDNLAMGKLTKAEMLIGNDDLTTAEPLNNATIATNQIEENLQMMNNYKIQLLSTGYLSPVQLNNLRTLAAKCPFEYGTAVYLARSVLSKYDLGIIYNNTCELIGNIKNKSMLNNNNENDTSIVNNPLALNSSIIKVSPNPANNKLTIELHFENSDNNCIFELYNMSGIRIMQNNLENGILNNINLFAITEGTYLYKIINDGTIVKTDKLIIIK